MRRKVFVMATMAVATLLFSGCGSANNGYVTGKMLMEKGQVRGVRTLHTITPTADMKNNGKHADKNNIAYRASLEERIYAIAKEALKNGYPYFALRFPEGSNKNPQAIVSVDKVLHYCVPGYYDKETDLLDDKCGHIGLGSGTPTGPVQLDGIFYKKRNPFIPLWDAKKTVKELGADLKKRYWKDYPEVFEKAMNSPHNFGTMEMD